MGLTPITDPKKRTTDARVLDIVRGKGLNADFVEFSDYAKGRPYSKLYTLHETGERIVVTSGLPMVRNTDGSKILPGFEQAGGCFWLKNNLFDGYVTGDGQIHIAVVNNQPDGPVAGDEMHSAPVLIVGGEVVAPKGVSLLDIDPSNPNYHDNVIEWDYGVCKRRIRIIEGRFRGTWIFPESPGADVRIIYNRTGKLTARYGRGYDGTGRPVEVRVPVNDVEFIPASAWDGWVSPVTVGDSATFYPDADPETATVDGYVGQLTGSSSWATLRGASGNFANSASSDSFMAMWTDDGTDTYEMLLRSAFLFDTGDIPDAATITSATLGVTLSAVNKAGSAFGVVAVSSNPATNTNLVSGDFTTLGSTALSGELASSSLSTGACSFTLNSSGIAAVSKNGVTKLGLRLSGDISNTAPAWYSDGYQSGIRGYYSEQGAGYKPALTVVYAIAEGASGQSSASLSASGSIVLSYGASGQSAASLSASAGLTAGVPASGSATASVSASGDLYDPARPVSGRSNASLSASGRLTIPADVSGRSDAEWSAAALLAIVTDVSGSVAARVSARASLDSALSGAYSGFIGRY